MLRLPGVIAMLAVMCILPVTAHAQARPEPPVGIRVWAVPYEWQRMTAAETFDATTGSSSIDGFGGGLDVLRLAGNLFVRVAFSSLSAEGQRVAIVDDEIVPFDPPIRLDVSLIPVEVGGGWRFAPRVRPGTRPTYARVTPYVGGGVIFVRYRESSEFDEPGEDAPVTFTGATFFGGVDFSVGGGVIIGGEAQYRMVPNALGESGASAHFGETDLGGFAVRVVVGFRK